MAAVPQGDALRLLLAAIAGNEPPRGLLEVRYRTPGGGMGQLWHDCHRGFAVVETILGLGQRTEVYVGAAPRRHRHGGSAAIERAWVLWADCDGAEAASAARAFRPLPSIVVRSGTGENVHAFWALDAALSADHARRANRRLAHALGADTRSTDVARILRCPGTLSHKHDPPAPVVCDHLDAIAYAARDIVGRLPDPPDCPPRRPAPAAVPVDAADPLLEIAPAVYVELLTGRGVPAHGTIRCPLPDHEDRTPSCHVYREPDRGWFCYGCDRGGTIIDLGATLYGIEPRGAGYHEVRRRLAAELLRGAA